MKSRRRGAALVCAMGLAAAGCAGGNPPAAPVPTASAAPQVYTPGSPELDFLIGRQLELEGRMPEALAAYRQAADRDPGSAYLQRKIAQISARQGDLAGAIVHAERAFEIDSEDPDTRLLLGTLYRVRKDTPAAERVLRQDDGEPLDEAAAFLLYTIYVENERYRDALETADWIVEKNPDSLRGWFAVAGVQEHLGQPLEVERALEEALAREPSNLAVYGALARSRRNRGDREGEVEIYRQVLERYPHHQATLSSMAEALIALGRNEEAASLLEELVRYHPEDTRSAVRLSLLDYDGGRYEQAAVRLEAVLSRAPDDHEVAYLLGLVRQRLGDPDGAVEALSRIPPEHRRFVDARTQVAVIHEERGEYALALEEVERARAVSPTRPLDLYTASLRAKTGDFDEAVAFLEVLLADSPKDDEILYNLGVLHGEAGHYDRALLYMQQSLEQNPDNSAALNYVGYTWAERGENLDEAERYIVRALELQPDDGYITDSLGWLYYMRAKPLVQSARAADQAEGRRLLQRAVQELERASELTGGDPVVAEHLGDVYLLLDDKTRALEFYGDAMQGETGSGGQPALRDKFERLRRELGVP
jgi:tetratricopeptide (TPR) repeat protein